MSDKIVNIKDSDDYAKIEFSFLDKDGIYQNFLTIDGEKEKLIFHKENFPHLDEDGFAKKFIEILEQHFNIKFYPL